MKKRILSLFLALLLCLSPVPAVGAAEVSQSQTDSAAAPAAVPEPEAAQTPQEQPAAQDAAALMSGESDSRDVAVFIPYYGEQMQFTLEPYYHGVRLADAMGGTCHAYLGKDATLDVLSNAFTTCRIIIIETHGVDGHVGLPFEDSNRFPDGQDILEHVHGEIVTELLFLSCCEGMKTEAMEKPMRDVGVDVVFGWSRPVICNTTDRKREMKELQLSIEAGRRRIDELDRLISRIYEDNIIGRISDDRYERMSAGYEKEQHVLMVSVAENERRLHEMEKERVDLRMLLRELREFTEICELTPELVNTLIQRIEIHNNDRSSGHVRVKVDVYFTAVEMNDLPTEEDLSSLIAEIQENGIGA